MSDTCHLTIELHPRHQATVVAAFGDQPAEVHHLADGPSPRCLLVFDDVEPHLPLAALARQGLTLAGSHADAADYPGQLFAAHGGELATFDQPFGVPSVPIDVVTRRIDEAALDRLAAYQRLIARVREHFDRDPYLDTRAPSRGDPAAGPPLAIPTRSGATP